ncbi:hypothetical protein ACJX0J_028648, partial [Zea mays]
QYLLDVFNIGFPYMLMMLYYSLGLAPESFCGVVSVEILLSLIDKLAKRRQSEVVMAQEGDCFRFLEIGDGSSTHFWQDRWFVSRLFTS